MSDDNDDDKAKTLQEALQSPCQHRDMKLALEPMPNFKSTPVNGGPNDTPLTFWAAWELESRPRRIALLLDDCQEDYRPYAGDILPNLQQLVTCFRAAQEKVKDKDGVVIVWSAWSRTFDDGISNAMDRWYGPRGLRPTEPENALYVFGGSAGMKPFHEIEPLPDEIKDGWFYNGKHLDMFWTFDKDTGKSYLDEKLKAHCIDTIVICGLWTDECILATAFGGSSRGYDVVVVGDAVATATANHQAALTVCQGTVGKVLPTQKVIEYMEHKFTVGAVGAVKGYTFPDGRKDDNE